MEDWHGFEQINNLTDYIMNNEVFKSAKNSCEGIKSGLVPAQPLSDLASPIDDPGCSINSEECCSSNGP